MNSERWQQLNRLFDAALARQPDERAAFLAAECGSDEALRGDVESLLAAHVAAGSFIERPAFCFDGTAPASAAPPAVAGPESGVAPAHRLGPYEVLALIGAGGMGEVYRARDPRLDREVAIKILPRHELASPAQMRRFEQEARAAGSLNHPNILAVYDVGTEGGVPYVVTELLDGDTLKARLLSAGLSLAETLGYAKQIAAGLAAAHAKGIVHRDLKPANLFVTRDGRLKILDFGLAKRSPDAPPARSSEPSDNTLPGVVVGTAGYMSPEQVQGRWVDARSDIFSFGAVLYEMLAGRRAFSGPTPVETLAAVLNVEPPALAELGRRVPTAVDELVRRCLRKDPAARPANGAALGAELQDVERALREGPTATAAQPAAPRVRHALAVLPFVNLSADSEQEYFCEGLAEDLIGALGRLEGLRMVARASSFRFRGRTPDLSQVARQLGVETVLEGSVRKSGNRLRIGVQLVRVADGVHLWSEHYDREAQDVFALQDEIVGKVVDALGARLVPGRPRARVRRPTDSMVAYQLYLKGRFFWNKRQEGGLRDGLAAFEQAIAADPAYAPAWAGVADSYALMGLAIYGHLPPQSAMPRAKAAARRALEIDSELADPHACLGWIALHYEWDGTAAAEHFARSLELEPERATTHHWLSFLLSASGRHDEAVAAARRAWELDPLSLIVATNLAQPLYYGRRFPEVVAEANRVLAMEPNFAIAHWWHGMAFCGQGRFDDAVRAFASFRDLGGGGRLALALAGHARGRAGDRQGARRTLEELSTAASGGPEPAYYRALVRLGLGELERALDDLEQSYDERCDQLAFLAVDAMFDPLRGAPRFAALLRRLRLDSVASAASRSAGAGPPERRSLAVLPFQDLGASRETEHLGLGLADAAITELARLRSLVVRPTSAILRYREAPVDATRAARELGVESLVEGSFQRDGERLRVTVRLLSGETGRSLWAGKIDTSLDDLFGMQDQVSREIARALELRLPSADASPLAGRAPRPPAGEAYDLYLKGRVHLFVETLEECLQAVDCFSQAVATDPDFALAWAGLADAYARIAFTFMPEGDWYARAWAACERALALDPELPEARYVRGGRLLWSPQGSFDHAGALRDLVPALRRRPSLEEGHVRLGVVLHHIGLIDELERQLVVALSISPEHALARQHQGLCHYSRGRYAEALAIYAEASPLSPTPWVHYRIALCEIQLGRLDDAERTLQRMRPASGEDVLVHPLRAILAALRGDAEAAREQVRLTVARRRDFGHYHHAQFDLACVEAQLGDFEEAVGWLREAARNGFPCLPDFAGDPLLSPLRGFPAYEALLADLRVEQRSFARLYAELSRESDVLPETAAEPAPDGHRVPPLAQGAAPGPSLAILPLRLGERTAANAHLGLGIADAAIAELARSTPLVLRPTASVVRFVEPGIDPVAAGRDLRADFVLTGELTASGEGLEIRARLVSTADGAVRGEAVCAAGRAELFRLPGLLAGEIARLLVVEPAAPLPSGGQPAGEAFELCLRGRVHLLRETLPELIAAVDCFDRAREADAKFAPAFAGLADAYARLAFDHQPQGDWYRRARAACETALALEADLPEARYVRARLLWSPQQNFDHAGALRELAAALRRQPALLEARLKVGSVLYHVGQLAAAGGLHQALLEQGMRHPAVLGYLGLCRFAEARYAEALDLLDEAASEAPGGWFAAQATLCRLHLEGAGGAGKRGRAAHGLAAALAGDAAAALQQAAAIARDLRPYGHFHHAEYDIACIHALLGDLELALRWLRAAAKDGFPCRPQFESDPWLAGLHGQPGFDSLLAEIGSQSAQVGALAGKLGLVPQEN